MSGRAVQIGAAVVATALVVVGVWWLRANSMSTHSGVPEGSALRVVMHVDDHRAEAGHTLAEMAAAKLAMCRLEVRVADVASGPNPLPGEGNFAAILRPTLDDTDRTQLRGCLEDWNVDQVMVDVRSMTDVSPAPGA